jgi:hypothetical protein
MTSKSSRFDGPKSEELEARQMTLKYADLVSELVERLPDNEKCNLRA